MRDTWSVKLSLLVGRHHFDGGQSVFELDRGDHHDHLVCVKCGKIMELHEKTIEKRQQTIAQEHGFVLEDHTLVTYGVCADCRALRLERIVPRT